jgi:hypothetical protein
MRLGPDLYDIETGSSYFPEALERLLGSTGWGDLPAVPLGR